MDAAFDTIVIYQERIEKLEKGIRDLRSQLKDGGYQDDSVVIVTIDNMLDNE